MVIVYETVRIVLNNLFLPTFSKNSKTAKRVDIKLVH